MVDVHAQIIDGKAIAAKLRTQIATTIRDLKKRTDFTGVGLAVVLVGDDSASQVYVRNKERACDEVGIDAREYRLPAEASLENICEHVQQLNNDDDIHGILVQFPLPSHIDEQLVIEAIAPHKDVDGLHPINVGRLAGTRQASTHRSEPRLVPCTPLGCLQLARTAYHDVKGTDLGGAHAVIIGRSTLVGKPLTHLLLEADVTVTLAHSRSQNLAKLAAQADILVAAVGLPGLVEGHWVKQGAVVIDVGINRVDGQLVGDVNFSAAAMRAAAITPVPGGVGPMTIAYLLHNSLIAACEQQGIKRVQNSC